MAGVVSELKEVSPVQRDRSTYQDLGNGVYRVTGAVRRSAVTGRFVPKASAERTTDANSRTGKVRAATTGRWVAKSSAARGVSAPVRNPREEARKARG